MEADEVKKQIKELRKIKKPDLVDKAKLMSLETLLQLYEKHK